MDISNDSLIPLSDEILLIKNLIYETKENYCIIRLGKEDNEKENFNENLKSFLFVILRNVYEININDENRKKLESMSYERLFFDIIELIIVKKMDYDCECEKLNYIIYNSLRFSTLLILSYKEKDKIPIEYNFIITLEITVYYSSNRIECEVKNIDIQYKIFESEVIKLIFSDPNDICTAKNGLSKIYKHVHGKNYFDSKQILKFISLFKNNNKDIILFNELIREILIRKGYEAKQERYYSNGLI